MRKDAEMQGGDRFTYSRRRLYLLAFFAACCLVLGVWLAGRSGGEDYFLSVVLVVVAFLAMLRMIRMAFDRRPAVSVSPEGLTAQRLGGKLIAWSEIDGVWMRWTKRRLLLVIPLDNPELSLSIPLDSSYWKSGGLGRRLMYLLSRMGDDTEVRINLNGLSGGAPERVLEAVRALRPDLIRDSIIHEVS